MINNILLVGIGGFFGSLLRYGLVVIFNNTTFAYGVLLANALGSFIAGVIFVLVSEKMLLNEAYHLVLIIGFCGSLTTLSALSLDSFNMLSHGNYALAIINLITNIVLSLLFLGLGVYLMRLSLT